MAFPGLFKRYFPLRTPYVALSEYMQDWEQCHRNVPDLNLLNMRSMSFKIGKHMLYNIAFDGAYFLLAVMVEEDESM